MHQSTGFSPYRLKFGEECTLPMDIGLPRQDPEPPAAISSPFAVWVRDALEVAFDQVRRHSGQAVQPQKRLYDQRVVRRLFAIGDWVMCCYPAAKKCKLDSVWVGPFLVVSIFGWAVGIQKHPDLPVILIHCHVKKVPQPSGMRWWIKTPRPAGAPTIPMLGASTVAHTSRGSHSIDVLPPDEGIVLADVDSVGGGRSGSESRASSRTMANCAGSRIGVSSDSVSSAGILFAATALRIDEVCVLHPFSRHKLDAGPVRLMTNAHAFNYRVAVLRDGVKSAVRVGRSRNGHGAQQVAVMFQIASTMALELPLFLEVMEVIRGVSPDVQLD